MTRRRLPSAEEIRLWRLAMRDAEPLPGRAAHPPEPEPPAPPAGQAPADGAKPAGGPLSSVASRPAPPPALPELDPQRPAGIDRRTDERLRRGRLDIDARIDLHGMSQDEAHGALVGFLLRCWSDQRRTVLVITGKGQRGGGILRSAVPRWLNEAPLRPLVLTVKHAQPRHGGEGALYVLLKRRRGSPS
ncbi:Smr/MutS family protein [Arenibaculum pallidiluteum]|uniref:Smr/MutS family protein n=1 Tax=Arenibaculum pallidiluteum TaxID=2812559 RepID=UPI001A979763|nr:Smr/MutS family protein [Arenibaculum pallidiluteum]